MLESIFTSPVFGALVCVLTGAWLHHHFAGPRLYDAGKRAGEERGWRQCRDAVNAKRQQELRDIYDSLDADLEPAPRLSVFAIRPNRNVVSALVRRPAKLTLNKVVVS